MIRSAESSRRSGERLDGFARISVQPGSAGLINNQPGLQPLGKTQKERLRIKA